MAATVLQLAATVLHVAATVLHFAATVLHVAATLLHLADTVLHVAATVLQFAETELQLAATVLQLAATVLQLAATVLHVAATVPACNSGRSRSEGCSRKSPIGLSGIRRPARSMRSRKLASRQACASKTAATGAASINCGFSIDPSPQALSSWLSSLKRSRVVNREIDPFGCDQVRRKAALAPFSAFELDPPMADFQDRGAPPHKSGGSIRT